MKKVLLSVAVVATFGLGMTSCAPMDALEVLMKRLNKRLI